MQIISFKGSKPPQTPVQTQKKSNPPVSQSGKTSPTVGAKPVDTLHFTHHKK